MYCGIFSKQITQSNVFFFLPFEYNIRILIAYKRYQGKSNCNIGCVIFFDEYNNMFVISYKNRFFDYVIALVQKYATNNKS